jgi:hypothetical protein
MEEEEEKQTVVDLYGIHVTEISTNGRARKGRKYFSSRRKDVACATDGEDSCFPEDAIMIACAATGGSIGWYKEKIRGWEN